MDRKIAGLLGAVVGIATIGPAQATTGPALGSAMESGASYADLLKPIPNAVAQLEADDAVRAEAALRETEADIQLAQYYRGYDHHHHHHHRYYRRRRYYHHHHHHHHEAFIGVPGVGVIIR